ncbi:DNA-binding protein RFX6-like [Physella acuta]|uniref:DNA-binding protein RFX6-like n=1 Tax=Physella acuta TaxID=109671 RepID=UPI0027DBDDC3|nr:DNA-binding protein RFX6-like [Physella acuta]
MTAIFEDLKNLLRKQSQVESYTEWVDGLVDKYVLQFEETLTSKLQHKAGRFLLQWTMFGALVMKELTLNNALSFSFLHLIKMTLDEYILLVMETQTDKQRDAQLQKNLQRHMKNAEEIKMSAKVRSQANRLQTSPKTRKRKETEHESEDETETNLTPEETFQNFSSSSTAHHQPIGNCPSFLRSLRLNLTQRDNSDNDINTTVPSLCSDSMRAPSLNPSPLTPIKHLPSYDRSTYLTPYFNSYTDYVTHASTYPSARQVQTLADHATSQTFHPLTFTPTVNPSPSTVPPYWTESRPHHSDPYSHLAYNYHQPSHDSYKKQSLLRGAVYQENITLPASDGFPRTNTTADGFPRSNSFLENLALPASSFDSSRTAMYYPRPGDNFQVGSTLPVGSYGNSFMEITPPSGQYHRQDGLFYQEEMFASNLAATSGLGGFTKTFLPAGYR